MRRKLDKRTYVIYWQEPQRHSDRVASVNVECAPETTEAEAHKLGLKCVMEDTFRRPPLGPIHIVRVDDMTHYEIDIHMTIKEIT